MARPKDHHWGAAQQVRTTPRAEATAPASDDMEYGPEPYLGRASAKFFDDHGSWIHRLYNAKVIQRGLNADLLDGKHAADIISQATTFSLVLDDLETWATFKLLFASDRIPALAFITGKDAVTATLTMQQTGVITGTVAEWADVGIAAGPAAGVDYYLSSTAGEWTTTKPVDGFVQWIGTGLPALASDPLQKRMAVLPHQPESAGKTIVETAVDYTASFGEAVRITGGTGLTITLPNIPASATGQTIPIYNDSGAEQTVACNGSDTIMNDTTLKVPDESISNCFTWSTSKWSI